MIAPAMAPDEPADVARLFDAMAGSYDVLEPWYEHLYERLYALVLTSLHPGAAIPGRSLDAGCGTGFQTALLEDLGYRSHGVDLSAGLLAVARGRLPGSRFCRADLEALPYRDEMFDAVSCCGSTLSFVADPAGAVHELGRVLKPGGRLLLECEHKWSLDLAWALVSAMTGDALGYGVSLREAWRQVARPLGEGFRLDYPVPLADGATASMRLRLFTRSELGAMLEAAGLTIVRVWGLHSVTNVMPSTVLHRERLSRPLGTLYRALRALDRAVEGRALGRWLGNSIVVLAVKAPVSGRRPARAVGVGSACLPTARATSPPRPSA